jgi:hypothetical protein
MRLHRHLDQLERRLPAGCPACRRGRVALVTAREHLDAGPGPSEGEPPPCAACGDVPERAIEIVDQVVELPLSEDSGVPEVAP